MISKLVGGWTNPFEKYGSKWESSSEQGWTQKMFELPPPSKVYWGERPKFTYATRAYNHPSGKDYKWYTSGIYC